MSEDEKALQLGRIMRDWQQAKEECILLETKARSIGSALHHIQLYLSGSPHSATTDSSLDTMPTGAEIRSLRAEIEAATSRRDSLAARLDELGLMVKPQK